MADLSKLRFNGTDYNVKDASAPLRKFTNYSKTGNLPITSDDTTQTAIGKLEKALDDKINTSAKGTASGVAELDANGKVPSSQLPSYVDDVLEYSAKSSFPATGETGKIYVDTTTNKTYRWSGSAYVEISESLALGETSSTAYRGDRGKTAYDHSHTSGNPHGTTGAGVNLTGYSKGSSKDAVAATDTVNAAIAKHENRINANQSNILSVFDVTGAKNCALETNFVQTVYKKIPVSLKSGIPYTIKFGSLASTDTDVSNCQLNLYNNDVFVQAIGQINRGSNITVTVTPNADANQIYLYAGTSYENSVGDTLTVSQLLVAPTQLYETSSAFTPPALPNYDLTRLESEDRAGLVECVDGGAKNILAPTDLVPYGDGLTNNPNLTCTNNGDGTYTLNGSTVGNGRIIIHHGITSAVYGGKMLSGCPNINTGSEKCRLSIFTDTGASGVCHDAGQGNEIPTSFNASHLAIYVFSGNTFSNVKFYPMICTKAAFGVSSAFVPYRYDPYAIVSQDIANGTLYARRNGRTVTVNGYVQNVSFTAAVLTNLGTINTTIGRPVDHVRSICSVGANGYTFGEAAYLTISTDGNVGVKTNTYSGTGAVFFSVSYTI